MLMGRSARDEQAAERSFREAVAKGHGDTDHERIMEIVSQHHCLPVMMERARSFRASTNPAEWIMDVGCGTGYYWKRTHGASLLLLDFAMGNLRTARTLLGESEKILFVQADASALPIKQAAVSGVWSVQVTQHFPDSTMASFRQEVKRVLKEQFKLEVYNLYPAWLYRSIYGLFGKKLHIRGEHDGMVLNRFNRDELTALWAEVAGTRKLEVGYSELFFHPDFHFRPRNRAIARLERLCCALPWLACLIARQAHVRVAS